MQTVLVCLMSEIKLYLRITIPFVREYKTKPFVRIKVIINYKTATTLMIMIMTVMVMVMVLVLNGNNDADGDDDNEAYVPEGHFTSFVGQRRVLFNLDFR